jgi:hypothetical protein
MESFEADSAHEPVEEPRVGRRPKFTEEEDLILVHEGRQLKHMPLAMARSEKGTKPLRSA